jgi:hypothetical protein
MTHHIRHDCNHECDLCELADPQTCLEFALMTAPDPEAVRFCKYCNIKAWHADIVIEDSEGGTIHRRYWECPRCHHMFIDERTPYCGTY